MSKRPVNLTIHSKILGMAKRVMALRGYSSLSAFVEDLVRDEYERRNGPMTFGAEEALKTKSSSSSSPASEQTAPEEKGSTTRRTPRAA